jgi:hypothetical protein
VRISPHLALLNSSTRNRIGSDRIVAFLNFLSDFESGIFKRAVGWALRDKKLK